MQQTVQFANPGHKLTNNRGNGQCRRQADASVKPERNLAFSEGRKTCKQFCFKKFAHFKLFLKLNEMFCGKAHNKCTIVICSWDHLIFVSSKKDNDF